MATSDGANLMNRIMFVLIGTALFAVACACGISTRAQSGSAQEWIPRRIAGMDYPVLARSARIEGQVQVVCTLNRDGSVASTKITGNPHPILASAAMKNASAWMFMAASGTGQLPKTATLVYSFKMEKSISQPMDPSIPHHPARQFVFEYPSSVKVGSEYCLLESSCY